MKKINLHPSFLQILYLITILILFSFIIYTPTLISGPLHITKRLILEENTIEGILLGILFIVSALILSLYKREVNDHKEQIHKIKQDKKKVEELPKIKNRIKEDPDLFRAADSWHCIFELGADKDHKLQYSKNNQ